MTDFEYAKKLDRIMQTFTDNDEMLKVVDLLKCRYLEERAKEKERR